MAAAIMSPTRCSGSGRGYAVLGTAPQGKALPCALVPYARRAHTHIDIDGLFGILNTFIYGSKKSRPTKNVFTKSMFLQCLAKAHKNLTASLEMHAAFDFDEYFEDVRSNEGRLAGRHDTGSCKPRQLS
jgi:hypothetical protein